METLLITGGTGFLGSHLLSRFYTRYRIILLKRSSSDTGRISDVLSELIVYDTDKISAEKIFQTHRIDCIIHLATNYGRQTSLFAPVIEDNLLFPVRLLDAAVRYGVKYFVNTDTFSSKNCYSYTRHNYLQTYILTKCQLSEWLRLMSDSKISVVNMRLEHVYGPRDNPDKFIPFLIRKLLSDKEAIDLSEGMQERDFIFAEDVVDAYEAVINNYLCNIASGFFEAEVGTGNAVPLKELILTAKNITCSKCRLNFGAREYNKGESMHSHADIRKLEEIGWKPKTSLADGLRKTIDYEKQRKETVL